eukprot:sb/3475159/
MGQSVRIGILKYQKWGKSDVRIRKAQLSNELRGFRPQIAVRALPWQLDGIPDFIYRALVRLLPTMDPHVYQQLVSGIKWFCSPAAVAPKTLRVARRVFSQNLVDERGVPPEPLERYRKFPILLRSLVMT